MNKDLKYAQSRLTESVIRRFWKAMTLSYPAMCVNDGVSIEYHKPFQQRNVDRIVDKLTRCKTSVNVACPIFQYDYDPPNSMPHHVSAITLTQMPNATTVLSFFDPKGRGSVRPRQEELIMGVLAKAIEKKTGRNVILKMYTGDNLQKNDDIGLCQLFSLFYLYEYVTEINKLNPKALSVLADPNAMVPFIRAKRRGFTDKTLLSFWQGFFPSMHRK